ncbi:MAG: response regulator [Spirochaetales bacterium]|nr:response regulator [Spirochaetales bacterium]
MEVASSAGILLVDDEEHFNMITINLLKLDGHDASAVCSAEDGFRFLEEHRETDIVLLDIDLGDGMSGTEALPLIIERYPTVQVVMLTSNVTLDTALDCMKKGAFDYLTKPFKKEVLMKIIPAALSRKKLIRLRDLYLEILVHDLKNPLQSISMGLDAVDADEEAVREKALNLARYGCWQIGSMISNILTITRFEKASPSLEFEEFLFEKEVQDHLGSLIQRMHFAGRKFAVILDKKKDIILGTDKMLFLGILSNLISNAIRFTQHGDSITVTAGKKDSRHIEVKVVNTGSFIEDHLRDKIFDKFFASDFHTENRKQNFGLGLTFSKLAVAALGGDIRVESRRDPMETAFIFTIRNHRK